MSRPRFVLACFSSVGFLLFATGSLYPQAPAPGAVTFAPQGDPAYRPQILGTTVHFGSVRPLGYTSVPRASDQLHQIGATSYRDGIAWASFDFANPAVPRMAQKRRIMDFLPVAGVRPLLILGTPPNEPAMQGAPFSDQQLAQFGAYVQGAVRLTQSYRPMFEVWNEYNMRVGTQRPAAKLVGPGDPSDPRAASHYVVLARAAVTAAKAANPGVPVIVGAVGEDPGWGWTRAIVRGGALNGAAGLSVHLYNQCARPDQRTAPEMIARLEQLQALLKGDRGGRETPMYVTEFGWPTGSGRCEVSTGRQAYNLAHFILQSSALPWLRGAWIYELKDEGQDTSDFEQNFGVFGFDDQPKPAACFVREARAIVAGARSVAFRQLRPDVFALRAVMPDRQIAAVWTSRDAPAGHVQLSGRPTVRTMCGQPLTAGSPVPVTPAPIVASYPLGQAITVRVSG